MRDITVCKFGGSSLADASCFRRVRDIIHSDDRRRLIIVSAPGKRQKNDIKITDALISACSADNASRSEALDSVRSRFCRIAADLGLCPPYDVLARLRAYARMGRDAIASRGEYLCARMLSEYTGLPFVDSAELFVFRNGTLDTKATYANLGRLHDPAIIPGFYGADVNGSIVTFPRGGSDITAAHIAAAIGADLYENWTDVNGFRTADPAVIPDALHIPHMSFSQARQFAYLGAGVLHYDSIAPAAEAGIPIIVKNTFDPDAPGTLISRSTYTYLPCTACVRLGENSYLLSCASQDEASLQHVISALPCELPLCIYGGTVSLECEKAKLHKLMRLMHDAAIQSCM